METPKIGVPEKLGYGFFSASNNMVIQFVNTFILFYFTDIFGLSPAVAGMIISFGLIWDGINDPLIANYADNHIFKNGDRMRPYEIYICLPLALTTILLFPPFHLPDGFKVFYAILIYVFFYSFTTFLRLPMYAMGILATQDTRQRISINTFLSGGASLGSVLASVMCWPIVRRFAGVDAGSNLINPQRGFLFGTSTIGLIIIFGSLFTYFTSKERVRPIHDAADRMTIIASFKILLKNYNFRWDTAFSTLYFVSNTLLTTTLVYYSQYVLLDSGKTTLIMAVFALGSIVALPLIKTVERKVGRRNAMILGAGLTLLARIPFVIMPRSLYTILVYGFIMGLSVALNIVTFSTTRAQVADLVEYENGRRIDAMVNNLMGFINKCGTSLTTLFIGFALQIAGYQGELTVQPRSAVTTIIVLQGVVGLAVSLAMIFAASRITIEEKVAEMKAGQGA
jgi:Na+/melibiose symporter-like transporter